LPVRGSFELGSRLVRGWFELSSRRDCCHPARSVFMLHLAQVPVERQLPHRFVRVRNGPPGLKTPRPVANESDPAPGTSSPGAACLDSMRSPSAMHRAAELWAIENSAERLRG
jgi:hypothetical protein